MCMLRANLSRFALFKTKIFIQFLSVFLHIIQLLTIESLNMM